jgi:hypothetical protein
MNDIAIAKPCERGDSRSEPECCSAYGACPGDHLLTIFSVSTAIIIVPSFFGHVARHFDGVRQVRDDLGVLVSQPFLQKAKKSYHRRSGRGAVNLNLSRQFLETRLLVTHAAEAHRQYPFRDVHDVWNACERWTHPPPVSGAA